MARYGRDKKKRHPNNKPRAKIVYAKPGPDKFNGWGEEMVNEEDVWERIDELKEEIYE